MNISTLKIGQTVWLASDGLIQNSGLLATKAKVRAINSSCVEVDALGRKSFGGVWTAETVFANATEARAAGRVFAVNLIDKATMRARFTISEVTKVLLANR